MKFRTRFSERKRSSFDVSTHPDTGEVLSSMTRQEHKEECDINSILARYERTGELPPGRQPRYVHCDSMTYQESLAVVQQANEAFHELPARIRDMYSNNPTLFLEAFDRKDPELVEAALKYGVIKERTPDALSLLSEVVRNTKPQKPAEKPGAGNPT